MNGYESDEDLNGMADILEDLESDEMDESDESDEARRRRRSFKPRVPTGKGLYRSRPTTQNVTQVQLQAALARVGAQIKTHADATKAVSTRLNALNERLDKEAATRKKADVGTKREAQRSREMSLFPLLLQQAPKVETKTIQVLKPGAEAGTFTSEDVQVVTKVDTSSSSNMLPLILMMGMGGEGSSDNNMMMMMALVMMNANK
jgi:hypothetical protein